MQKLCAWADVKAGSGKEVILNTPVGVRYIAIFRFGPEVRAYLNSCPHQGRSLNWAPDEFLLGGDGRLVCPHHGASFELASGACVDGPCIGASLTPVRAMVINGDVWGDLNPDPAAG